MSGTDNGLVPSKRAKCIFFAVCGISLLLDVATKTWAVRSLADGPKRILGDFLSFRLGFNSGAAFSSFEGWGVLLGVIAVLAVVWLFLQLNEPHGLTVVLGFSLIAGGALGNVMDRLFRGEGWMRGGVVDFIDMPNFLPFGGDRWAIFNIADMCVVGGVGLVLIWTFFGIGDSAHDLEAGPSAQDESPSSPSTMGEQSDQTKEHAFRSEKSWI